MSGANKKRTKHKIKELNKSLAATGVRHVKIGPDQKPALNPAFLGYWATKLAEKRSKQW